MYENQTIIKPVAEIHLVSTGSHTGGYESFQLVVEARAKVRSSAGILQYPVDSAGHHA